MILRKELGITIQSQSDLSNDSASLTQPNTEK